MDNPQETEGLTEGLEMKTLGKYLFLNTFKLLGQKFLYSKN